jgi:hypothetical protein
VSRLAIHLNDAAVTVSDGRKIVYREPGYAFLGDDGLETGSRAFARARIDPRRIQHRFWCKLDTAPLSDKRFSHLSAADLASAQLETLWQAVGKGVNELVVAAPAWMTTDSLGLFLGIASELKLPVVAIVDAPVAATRREYQGGVAVHIDLGLHRATLTRLAQPGMTQTDRSEVIEDAGLYALYDAWLTTVAEAFVLQSRFDPLHTAETEQMLLDRLAGWLSEATRRERVAMQVEFGGGSYEAEVESLALIGAAAPVYQQIATRLRSLFRAEDIPAIQVTNRFARLPGLTEMLKARVGGEVFVLEPGATARGAFDRCRGGAEAANGISLLRQLPWDQVPVDMHQHADESVDAGVPTHLLYGHTAYAIDAEPLTIGSQGAGDARLLTLGADMPGVSRRHCSVLRRNGQCVLEDHSRYGTFLNGHRIEGTAILQVGDALRIGSPGFEFQLIAAESGHG